MISFIVRDLLIALYAAIFGGMGVLCLFFPSTVRAFETRMRNTKLFGALHSMDPFKISQDSFTHKFSLVLCGVIGITGGSLLVFVLVRDVLHCLN